MACLFGEIKDGKMLLNEMGIIAHNEWIKTAEIRKNVELDEFIIMPNHIHGIIILNESGKGESNSKISPQKNISTGESNSPNSIICNSIKPSSYNHDWGECNSPLRSPSNNIGAIVRGYKSSVTKQLNLLNIGRSVWHRNYYEHLIKNARSYQNISNYFLNNPSKWKDDKFNKEKKNTMTIIEGVVPILATAPNKYVIFNFLIN